MKRNFRSPLAGKPATTETRARNGAMQYRVKPRVLTPKCAKLAD